MAFGPEQVGLEFERRRDLNLFEVRDSEGTSMEDLLDNSGLDSGRMSWMDLIQAFGDLILGFDDLTQTFGGWIQEFGD